MDMLTHPKRRVLIVEDREEWQEILSGALTKGKSAPDIQMVRSYDEALRALSGGQFDLAVIDLSLDVTRHDHDRDGTHDGLQTLIEIGKRFPDTRLIVVGETLKGDSLKKTPGVPASISILDSQDWDATQFEALAGQLLSEPAWGPPAPEISVPADSGAPAAPPAKNAQPPAVKDISSGTGMTGPLHTGLMPPPVGSRPGKPRVLIVEDEVYWQDTLARLMEDEEYFWRVAPDHEQAQERLRLETFHIVTLDLVLGDEGLPLREGKGWQLLDYLVNHCPKTKVVIVSGHASSSDVAKLFMGYPIKGYMDKGAFNVKELLSLIREQVAGPALRIVTLGDFRIWRDGKLINDYGQDLAETVIKILLTRRGEAISVEELIALLWPGRDPHEHFAQLGSIISSARMTLEPDLPRSSDSKFILRDGANYTFNIENADIDAERLRQLVSDGRRHERHGDKAQALRCYSDARELYRGDYLPTDRTARWTMQERGALQALFSEALNRLADLYAERRDLEMAIEVATQALKINAYGESTYRRLMRYHACQGHKAAALGVYRSLAKLFSEFFNEEPRETTKRLYADIEAGRPVDCGEASAEN